MWLSINRWNGLSTVWFNFFVLWTVGDHGRRRLGLGQRGEAAHIDVEQCGTNGFADIAPRRSCRHARGAAPADGVYGSVDLCGITSLAASP